MRHYQGVPMKAFGSGVYVCDRVATDSTVSSLQDKQRGHVLYLSLSPFLLGPPSAMVPCGLFFFIFSILYNFLA